MNAKNLCMIVLTVASGYFAFTSGGGVRAIYWLALVLAFTGVTLS